MIIELVKYPVLTEKSVRLMDMNQYTFDVDLKFTKPQIKTLVSSYSSGSYWCQYPPPTKEETTHSYTQGKKASYKRVIISVKRGQSIQILPTEK